MNLPRRCIAALCSVASLSSCVTYSEVLLGVQEEDPHKIRMAARRQLAANEEPEVDRSNICGLRPLHLAINKKNSVLVEVLLQEGANPSLTAEIPREPSICADGDIDQPLPGMPPLHWAMLRGERRSAEAILFAGADPGQTTPDGESACALAKRLAVATVADYLDSPIHLAVRTGDFERLKIALQSNANPNRALSRSGTTPLEEALVHRQWFAVGPILSGGGGVQATLSSPEVRTAIEEFLVENPESPHRAQIRSLMTLEVVQ